MAARKTSVTVDDVIGELGALPTQAQVARALGMDGKTFRNATRSLGVYVSRGGAWNADTMRALYDARPSIARRVDALVESRNA
jgi:hypothetical protein